MSVPQAHDSNAPRDNVAERPNMSMLTQLEATAQVHDAGHGFEPPMHGELPLPLLPGEPATPPRLGGRQPQAAYAKQLAWIRAADAWQLAIGHKMEPIR